MQIPSKLVIPWTGECGNLVVVEMWFSVFLTAGIRKVGEGVDDPSQGVISAEPLPEG